MIVKYHCMLNDIYFSTLKVGDKQYLCGKYWSREDKSFDVPDDYLRRLKCKDKRKYTNFCQECIDSINNYIIYL